jgi:hypothetical protein
MEATTTGMSDRARQADRRYNRDLEQATASVTGVWPAPVTPVTPVAPIAPSPLERPDQRPEPAAATQRSAPGDGVSGYVAPALYSGILTRLVTQTQDPSAVTTGDTAQEEH